MKVKPFFKALKATLKNTSNVSAQTTPYLNTNEPIGSITQRMIDTYRGRIWSGEAIDRFVVGRIYLHFDLEDSCIDLRLACDGFGSINIVELEYFENHDLPQTDVRQRWISKTGEDDEVQKMLRDIARTSMADIDEFRVLTKSIKAETERLRMERLRWEQEMEDE